MRDSIHSSIQLQPQSEKAGHEDAGILITHLYPFLRFSIHCLCLGLNFVCVSANVLLSDSMLTILYPANSRFLTINKLISFVILLYLSVGEIKTLQLKMLCMVFIHKSKCIENE